MPIRRAKVEEADILTWSEIEKAVCWSDRIYHMAAVVGMFKVLKEPIKVLAVNIAGSERILRAAQANTWSPDILIASTSEVYGNRDAAGIDLSEEMEPVVSGHMTPRSNYAVSKIADELFGISYARQHNLKVRIVRFFNVIGPRQTGIYGMVAPRFVNQAVTGLPITVYGDGTQTRCFLDVRDAVTALDRLIGNPASIGEIVNVGCQHEVTINQLAELVQRKSPVRTTITHTPYEQAYGKEFDEIYHRRPSVKKLQALTGFTPQWDLEKTIMDLIQRKEQDVYEPIETIGEENGNHTIFYSEPQHHLKSDRFIAGPRQNRTHAQRRLA